MPKMKTHSGAKKRFKKTGSGKIKRQSAYTSHLMGSMSNRQKKRLAKSSLVSDADMGRVKDLLCI